MDIQKLMNIVNQVKNIPFLQDEKIKSGDLSNLNEMSILHYVVFPFLGTLGYEIYNPNEVKVEGLNRVDLYASGNIILSFNINVKNLEINNFPPKNLLIETNGIRYIVYGDNEKILDFDIRNLDKENLNLIFGLLLKENIFKSVGNSKFISEKIIETNSGNLKETKYFNITLRDLLVNPSSKFLESFSERLFELYCETANKSELNLKIIDEFNRFDFLSYLINSKESNVSLSSESSITYPIKNPIEIPNTNSDNTNSDNNSNDNSYDSYLTLPSNNKEEEKEKDEKDDLSYLLDSDD